ncbi:MAG: NAD(P)H-dependent oxidoreductase subunit E [bacterium]
MSALTLESILKGRRSQPHQLIEVLQDVQERYSCIPEEDMRVISRELGVPQIEVYRVASFYKAFSLKPRGKNVITICAGTACHVRGAKLLSNQIRAQLGISPGDTTEDGQFTLEQVNCLGACALGPVVVLSENGNQTYYSHMSPGKIRSLINSLNGKRMEDAYDVKGTKPSRSKNKKH